MIQRLSGFRLPASLDEKGGRPDEEIATEDPLIPVMDPGPANRFSQVERSQARERGLDVRGLHTQLETDAGAESPGVAAKVVTSRKSASVCLRRW